MNDRVKQVQEALDFATVMDKVSEIEATLQTHFVVTITYNPELGAACYFSHLSNSDALQLLTDLTAMFTSRGPDGLQSVPARKVH